MDLTENLQALLAEQQFECLEWLLFREYSQHTIRAYSTHLKRFRAWVNRQPHLRLVSDLSAEAVTDFLVDLSLTKARQRKPSEKSPGHLSSSYRNGVISALTQFFAHLYKRGFILVNPMHEVERPADRRGLPRNILTLQEVLRVFAVIDTTEPVGLRNRAALEVIYSAGLRSGELEKLNVGDLDLGQRVLLVHGKGNKMRYVPIGTEAQKSLQQYLTAGRPKFRAAGSQALFLSSLRGRMDIQSLQRYYRRYAQKAGITKSVDLHGLRHTCATHMLKNGADIRYIQTLLGHSSLTSTQIYTRVEPSDLKKVLDDCHPRDKF